MLGGVTYCVFESPILPKQTSLATVRKLSGLAWHTEFVCHRRGIEVAEVNVMTIKAFMGNGWASKQDMDRAVRRYGFAPQSYDEADAIALRLYVLHQKFRTRMPQFGLELGLLGAGRM